MKKIVKKISILAMLSMMQIGLGALVTEASPPQDSTSIEQQDDQDQDQDRHEAERIENERHERVMERRANESDREWEERQDRENERHERNLTRIAHALLI